jgi:NADPH:quinone reductase-like Zn-dependent oxidoreductase
MSKIMINWAVRYNNFGDVQTLHLVELPVPEVDLNEVLIRVKAAGINPGEIAIREGHLKNEFPSVFPSGQGTDFAGIIVKVGAKVQKFKVGEEVIGYSNNRNSQATFVAVAESHLISKPSLVTWEQAGALFVAATTAFAAIKAVSLEPNENVIISGATGGVGVIATQIAHKSGARVFGIASKSHHKWLIDHNVIPISYGSDLEKDLVRALGDNKVHAFMDLHGNGYVDLAIRLGVASDRINTIIDFEAAKRFNVKTDGSSAAASIEVLSLIANMIQDRELDFPIAARYVITDVQKAYEHLAKRHTLGKIVLIP